jgi:hypothetical protein
MKAYIFILIAVLGTFTGFAQTDYGLYIYRNDGQFNSIPCSKVDSITYSNITIDNTANDDYVTQIIYTKNCIYKIPLASIDSISFTVCYPDRPTPGDAIDLGLSVKWASHNIGATSPEEYGSYFAWGETEEKGCYDEYTYPYYNYKTGECVDLGSDIRGTSYDVAHVKWGGNWRLPTMNEQRELVKKCAYKWTTYNGVAGGLFTGPNGNSIFLPSAGYYYGAYLNYEGSYGQYWSSTPSANYHAFRLIFNNVNADWYYSDCRVNGFSVCPVLEESSNESIAK